LLKKRIDKETGVEIRHVSWNPNDRRFTVKNGDATTGTPAFPHGLIFETKKVPNPLTSSSIISLACGYRFGLVGLHESQWPSLLVYEPLS
jgi:hypothetical protein